MNSIASKDLRLLKKWRVSTFWVALVGYMGYYLCRQNLSAAAPLLEKIFSYSNAQLGLIALYSEITYAVGKFVNGPLADKVGGKKIFLLGMAGAIVSNFLFAFGSSLIYFIVVWCVCRYFLSMGWGGLTKMIGHWYEPERNGTIMGWISLSFQFGGVVATLFAGFLVQQGAGWQELFIYPPLVLTVIFVWTYFASKESPKDIIANTSFGHSPKGKLAVVTASMEKDKADKVPHKIILDLFKLSVFRRILLFSFVATFIRSIFLFWTPKFLSDIGMGASNAIMQSALFPFLGCFGTILLGWYTDTYVKNGDRARMMWIMLLGLVVSLLGIAWLMHVGEGFLYRNVYIVILTGLCGFFLLGPYSMSAGCLTLDIAGPNAAGSSTGLIDGIGYVGAAISVWGTGILSDALGWAEVFLFLAGCALLAVFAAYLMSREFQRQARA